MLEKHYERNHAAFDLLAAEMQSSDLGRVSRSRSRPGIETWRRSGEVCALSNATASKLLGLMEDIQAQNVWVDGNTMILVGFGSVDADRDRIWEIAYALPIDEIEELDWCGQSRSESENGSCFVDLDGAWMLRHSWRLSPRAVPSPEAAEISDGINLRSGSLPGCATLRDMKQAGLTMSCSGLLTALSPCCRKAPM